MGKEAKIKSGYPGMTKDTLTIDGIDFPVIKGVNVNYNSPALYTEFGTLLDITGYNYFAIATKSYEENLSLAMKARELLIRNFVSNGRSQELMAPPPVAFLCRNDNINFQNTIFCHVLTPLSGRNEGLYGLYSSSGRLL